ncbi:MAG: RNA polymerase sigma factor [Bacteroidetes bacterium]|nr:MAG: RNA polymerase sigma factor [Bacteroidota bacterium]
MIPLEYTYEPRAGQNYLAALEEEPELLRRALAQDANAFTTLCHLHLGTIYATCMRILANKDKANDVTQEVVISAWEKLRTFRGECPFSAWLHRIAVNAALDHVKTNRRLASNIEFTGDVERYETGTHAASPDIAIDLEEAIASLPDQARTVLVLHDIEGYRHDEIAQILDIAVGTSKAHLHQARLVLKEILQS